MGVGRGCVDGRAGQTTQGGRRGLVAAASTSGEQARASGGWAWDNGAWTGSAGAPGTDGSSGGVGRVAMLLAVCVCVVLGASQQRS